MDVTPRELRDLEIREAFRGYSREDVDDLLERAAKTIEAANDRVRQLTDRVQAGEGDAGKTREMEETLRRTLILAQRTADQAIAEAEAQARTTVDEAEMRARTLLNEAESQAKRAAEAERRRLENEILELGSRREALLADVEALERFDHDYRTRLRQAIEADLDALTTRAAVPSAPRPPVHDVAIPTTSNRATMSAFGSEDVELDTTETEPSSGASSNAAPSTTTTSPSTATPPTPAPAPPARAPEPGVDWSRPGAQPTEEPAGGRSATPAGERTGLFGNDAPIESQVLDDDAFFATLREAVRDDAPLGPREDDGDASQQYLDEDADSGRFGSVFKRRR